MGIGKCGREQYKTFGENTFYSSVTVHIYEVIVQDYLSQVVRVYFSQKQGSFIKEGKVPSSEITLLPSFDH